MYTKIALIFYLIPVRKAYQERNEKMLARMKGKRNPDTLMWECKLVVTVEISIKAFKNSKV